MKKIMTFAAVIAAAMMSFSACQKDEKPAGQGNNNGGSENVDPGNGNENQGGTDEYVSPITIDGDFADWAALDASKVAVANGAADAYHNALKVMKVYADEIYINVYFEFESEPVAFATSEWLPVHLYFNSDGDSATGGYGDEFSDACVDYMMENAISSAGVYRSYNPSLSQWVGEANASGWSWSEQLIPEDSGLASGAGSGYAYEIAILKEMVSGVTFADKFGIGMDIQANWTSVGILPNASADADGNAVYAPMLEVTTNK